MESDSIYITMATTVAAYSAGPHLERDEDKESWPTVIVFVLIFSIILSLLVVAENVMVMATFWKYRSVWQRVPHVIIFNLSIAGFFVGALLIPINALYVVMGRWIFGEFACKLINAFVYIITFIPVILIISLLVLRLLLMKRLRVYRSLKRSYVTVYLVITWIVCFGIYIFLAFGVPAVTHTHAVDYRVECFMEYLFLRDATVAVVCLEMVCPFILVVVLSLTLVWEIRRRSRRVVVGADLTTNSSSVTVEGTSGSILDTSHTMPSVEGRPFGTAHSGNTGHLNNDASCSHRNNHSLNVMNSVRSAWSVHGAPHPNCPGSDCDSVRTLQVPPYRSRASGGQGPAARPWATPRRLVTNDPVRGHRKAAVMLFALVVAYLICWLPYSVASIIKSFALHPVSDRLFYWLCTFVHFNSLINPIIFGLANTHFRQGFIRILGLTRTLNLP